MKRHLARWLRTLADRLDPGPPWRFDGVDDRQQASAVWRPPMGSDDLPAASDAEPWWQR